MWLKRLGLVTLAVLIMAAAGAYFVLAPIALSSTVTVLQPRISSIGANILVVQTDTGKIVVDSQLPALSWITRWHVGRLKAQDRVIVTHWHPDHSGGYATFAGAATVWSHKNTRYRLAAPQIGHHLTAPDSLHHFAARRADQLPNDHTRLPQRPDMQVLAFAHAHTDGDLAVYFPKANIFALGDLLWPKALPFVDIYTGGAVPGLLDALDRVLEISNKDTVFVPGHGDPIRHEEVVAYKEMVIEAYAAIHCPGVKANFAAWESSLVPINRWQQMAQPGEPPPHCEPPDVQ